MPRRNKSVKSITFGGYKRGGGFFDNLTTNLKKTGDMLKESGENINKRIDRIKRLRLYLNHK
mgnify:CR=1 FL=1